MQHDYKEDIEFTKTSHELNLLRSKLMHLDETIQGLEKARSKVREKIEKLEAHKKSLFPHPDQEEQKRTLMVFKSYNPDVVDDYDDDDDVVLR